MFKHPNYYKKLKASQVKKSDQVISSRAATAGTSVHPGPGHKRQAIEESVPHNDIEEAQASSNKPQASSTKLLEEGATSVKRQA
jgi:hypothetical protein